jgi:hypothetical protein
MDEISLGYFRERERIEREAASKAACDSARLAHERLAAGYAALIRDMRKSDRGTLTGLWSSPSPASAHEGGAIRRHGGGAY